jgi:hypothetical protein
MTLTLTLTTPSDYDLCHAIKAVRESHPAANAKTISTLIKVMLYHYRGGRETTNQPASFIQSNGYTSTYTGYTDLASLLDL